MCPRSSDFALTKWYMDVVDEHQNVYIGYWLALTWRKLQLHGHRHLVRTTRDGVTDCGGWNALPAPVWDGATHVRWSHDDLSALWTAEADPIEATLFQSERGEIRWRCLMPKARGLIELPQLSVRGWGYVERLETTVPAWNLPFDHLYWGRCHTADHTLVWIRWSGETSQALAWHNGCGVADLAIADAEIRTSECRLTIEERVPLCDGRLLSRFFRPLDAIAGLLPRSALRAHERKWVGQGTLHVRDTSEPATILYEEVTW
jgi:hypothetical protein